MEDPISDLKTMHHILKTEPQRYLNIVNQKLLKNPDDAYALFQRHMGWMAVGEPGKALEDISKSVELDPGRMGLWSRGDLHRQLGQYKEAAADYARAEALDPRQWVEDAFPLLYQADVHARLGDEEKALACCEKLPEHFWTPGMNELPCGGKSEIADELARRAFAARKAQSSRGS
jgi:tetratricopeptide (TPR) repeat protein